MHIDCARCPVRGAACTDCLVTHVFEVLPPVRADRDAVVAALPLDSREAGAVHAFQLAGLVSDAQAGALRATSTVRGAARSRLVAAG